MDEQWRDIHGWVGMYQVSDLGRVRSLVARNRNGQKTDIMKAGNNAQGYPCVRLSCKPRTEVRRVHQLVMDAFRGQCPDGYEVNHINGVRNDNHLENLEYVTPSENQLHRYRVLNHPAPKGEKSGKSKLTNAQVIEICDLLNKGYKQNAIARLYNVVPQAINNIATGYTWKHLTATYLKKGGAK